MVESFLARVSAKWWNGLLYVRALEMAVSLKHSLSVCFRWVTVHPGMFDVGGLSERCQDGFGSLWLCCHSSLWIWSTSERSIWKGIPEMRKTGFSPGAAQRRRPEYVGVGRGWKPRALGNMNFKAVQRLLTRLDVWRWGLRDLRSLLNFDKQIAIWKDEKGLLVHGLR